MEHGPANEPIAAAVIELVELMRRLRREPDGCPWDLEQTFASLTPYTLEEAFEVVDAIEREAYDDLEDELGDLLLQVVFHAQIAAERGLFDLAGVARAISAKLIRRHPAQFGGVASIEDQRQFWEAAKAAERARKQPQEGGPHSALDGIARALPALQRALKLQARAARVGFDWPEARQVLDKLKEEIVEVEEWLGQPDRQDELTDEIGDVMFTVVNLARRCDIDPESALRHANRKFEQRFRALEGRVRASGRAVEDAPLAELEDTWQAVKREGASGSDREA